MMTNVNSILVVGLGYIGLPTAAIFASRKMKVTGLEVNPKVVATVNQGNIHIVEPDLDIAVHAAVSEGYLRATSKAEPADAFLIAVPTPFRGENREPDLSYIESAARSIASVLKKGDLVILESTSPVGATEQMAAWLAGERPDLKFPQTAQDNPDIHIAHCPERVLPGKVMQELIHNDRIIGGMTRQCAEKAVELYKIFVTGKCVIASSPRVAEMAKLCENSFRDVNIAFANELSMICSELDINAWELISLSNLHPRVNILFPGPGVGGHCIAVDPWFIVSKTPELARLIRTAREVNDSKPYWVIDKVKTATADYLAAHPNAGAKDITIACYGIAFKADIDDLRESPALQIVTSLLNWHPGQVWIVEPNIEDLPPALAKGHFKTADQASDADIHVMLVDHVQFTNISKPNGICVDTKGIW